MTIAPFRYAGITLLTFLLALMCACGRPASDADIESIRTVLNGTWQREDRPLQVEPVVVLGRHAVAGWIQEGMGGRALLERSKQGWQVVVCGGDLLRTREGLVDMGVPESTAAALAEAVRSAERDIPEAQLLAMASFKGLVRMRSADQPPAGSQGPVQIRNAWSRATPEGVAEAVVYLQVENSGAADQLVGLSSDVSDGAGLHETRSSGSMVGMRRVPILDIPAHATLDFSPGGLHVMLTGLRRGLKQGEHFVLAMQFRNAAEQKVDVVVADIAASGPGEAAQAVGHKHMHH